MRVLRVVALITSLFALQGCASIALTAGGLAGGAGLDHAIRGVNYKTFAIALPELRLATLKSLNRMAMDVTEDGRAEDGWAIQARATKREIDIELEAITALATRMRVVVTNGAFFLRDGATGAEIIARTAETLDHQTARVAFARDGR
jgi:hypothetical protein